MTKLIVRLDLANPLGLRLEDGSTPKSLKKGDVVLLSENEGVQRDVKIFGNLLVSLDSEAGQRALIEVAFERDKEVKVRHMLAKMGCKSVRAARNRNVQPWEAECPTATGFITDREKTDQKLVDLLRLIRSECPPAAPPSFLANLFQAKK
jgi:hypothetical protein